MAAEFGNHSPDSHEPAFVAHRLEELLGDVAAIGHPVELDMGNVVGIEVPWVKVGRLVPPTDHIDLGFGAGFDNGPRIRRVVRIDIQHHVSAGLGDHRANVGNALLAVGLGDKDRAGKPDLRGESVSADLPYRVIRIGKRADRRHQRGLPGGGVHTKWIAGGERASAKPGDGLQHLAAIDPRMSVAFDHVGKSSLGTIDLVGHSSIEPQPYEAASCSIHAGVKDEKLYDNPSTGRPYQNATEATRERAKKMDDLRQAIPSIVRSPPSLTTASPEFH